MCYGRPDGRKGSPTWKPPPYTVPTLCYIILSNVAQCPKVGDICNNSPFPAHPGPLWPPQRPPCPPVMNMARLTLQPPPPPHPLNHFHPVPALCLLPLPRSSCHLPCPACDAQLSGLCPGSCTAPPSPALFGLVLLLLVPRRWCLRRRVLRATVRPASRRDWWRWCWSVACCPGIDRDVTALPLWLSCLVFLVVRCTRAGPTGAHLGGAWCILFGLVAPGWCWWGAPLLVWCVPWSLGRSGRAPGAVAQAPCLPSLAPKNVHTGKGERRTGFFQIRLRSPVF